MTSGSLNASPRAATPLFQVQPRGLPFIAHRKIGRPTSRARRRASQRSVCHGIACHWSSSGCGWTAAMMSRNVGAAPPNCPVPSIRFAAVVKDRASGRILWHTISDERPFSQAAPLAKTGWGPIATHPAKSFADRFRPTEGPRLQSEG